MNHEKMIRSTIDIYSGFPKVQQDMRKLLKYASSWQRMNLDPIINNEPVKVPNPQLDAFTTATEEFESTPAFTPEVRADAVAVAAAVAAQVIMSQAGAYDAAKQEMAVKYSGQPAVTGYLKNVARVIVSEIEALAPAELLAIRKA